MFDRMFLTLQILRGDLVDRLSRDEEGATAVEYGLLVALIAAVIVVVVGLLGTEIQGAFQDVCNAVKGSACS